jgi:hypothetical protein
MAGPDVLDGEVLRPDADTRKRYLLIDLQDAVSVAAGRGLRLPEFQEVIAHLTGQILAASGIQEATPYLATIAGLTRVSHSAALAAAQRGGR